MMGQGVIFIVYSSRVEACRYADWNIHGRRISRYLSFEVSLIGRRVCGLSVLSR